MSRTLAQGLSGWTAILLYVLRPGACTLNDLCDNFNKGLLSFSENNTVCVKKADIYFD